MFELLARDDILHSRLNEGEGIHSHPSIGDILKAYYFFLSIWRYSYQAKNFRWTGKYFLKTIGMERFVNAANLDQVQKPLQYLCRTCVWPGEQFLEFDFLNFSAVDRPVMTTLSRTFRPAA